MLRLKKRNRREIAFFLSIMLLSMSVLSWNATIASAEELPIALYETENFYYQSIPEPMTLQLDANSFSVSATCAEGQTDTIICYIDPITTNIDPISHPFEANGVPEKVYKYIPSGIYRITFVSKNGDVLKTDASIVCWQTI